MDRLILTGFIFLFCMGVSRAEEESFFQEEFSEKGPPPRSFASASTDSGSSAPSREELLRLIKEDIARKEQQSSSPSPVPAPSQPSRNLFPQEAMSGPFASIRFNTEQRALIQKMMLAEQDRLQDRQQQIAKLNQGLQALLIKELWDHQAIMVIYRQFSELQLQTVTAMIEARNRIYATLTDEQRSLLKFYQLGETQSPTVSPFPQPSE